MSISINKKQKAQLDAIDSHYSVISFKPDGTIIEANQNFLDALGYELKEIVGKHHSIFCDKKYIESNEYKNFWADLAMGKVQTEEFKRIKKNGDSIFIQASYKPLKDSDGKVFEILKLAQDITQRKLTSLYNQGQIEAINKSQAVIEFDKNGIILNANENFLNTTGYKLEEIIGEHHSIFCEDSYKNSPDYQEFWQKLNEGKFDCGEYLRVGKNNRRIWIQATYNPIFDLDNNIVKIIKFAHDITQEKLSILFYTGQLEAINKSQSIIEFDMNGVILNANENFLQAMGYELHEIVGKYHSIFCDEIYSNSSEYKKFWEELKKGNYDTGKYLRLGKNQKKVWIQATYTPILDIDKKPVKIVKFAQDITKYEIIKKDHLTNLYNREKLIIDIDAEKKEEINLAIIDIDDFSSINDFYGYFVGDKLIIKFSEILIKLLNDEFIVYRIYGDKFAIYNTTFSKKEFYEQITELCKKIKETSLDLDVKNFHLLITCGISFEEKSKLLNTAEIVNKFAKKVLKNILVYSDELNIEKEYEENIYWAEKIKLAIKEDRIIVHYQAIYNNKTKKIEKYEALVRLQERDGEIISPFKFLNIAKRSKQYLEITKIVIDKSFNTFKDKDYEFSINLTVEDILDEDLNEYLILKIIEFKVANKLVLELVESEKITTYEPVYAFINKFKSMGCKIAIDDFGSGYSNFEYLLKIDADFVKIDGSIIRRIIENENSLEIVKSIIIFCKKMGIKTIAEFICDEALLEKVSELELDFSQGFYIGKPKENIDE